jgi:hypothetical protein
MRRIDEIRSRCNPVVSEQAIGLPLDHNGEAEKRGNVTVN